MEKPLDYSGLRMEGMPVKIFDVLFHIFLLSLVLHVLYRVRLESLERKKLLQIFGDDIGQIASGLIEPGLVTQSQKDFFMNMFGQNEDFDWGNRAVRERNGSVVFFLGVLAFGYLAVMCGLCRAHGTAEVIKTTLVNNFILLIAVALLEGAFIYLVVLNYFPVMPSQVNREMVEKLKKLPTGYPPPEDKDSAGMPLTERVGGFLLAFVGLGIVLHVSEAAPGVSIPLVMWEASAIGVVVAALFFGFGTTQEANMLDGTVDRVVQMYAVPLYDTAKEIGGKTKEKLDHAINALEPPDASAADRAAQDTNARLRRKALYIVLAAFGAAATASWLTSRFGGGQHHGKLSIILYSCSMAALCSFIAEWNFLLHVLSEARSISSADIARQALSHVQPSAVPNP